MQPGVPTHQWNRDPDQRKPHRRQAPGLHQRSASGRP